MERDKGVERERERKGSWNKQKGKKEGEQQQSAMMIPAPSDRLSGTTKSKRARVADSPSPRRQEVNGNIITSRYRRNRRPSTSSVDIFILATDRSMGRRFAYRNNTHTSLMEYDEWKAGRENDVGDGPLFMGRWESIKRNKPSSYTRRDR